MKRYRDNLANHIDEIAKRTTVIGYKSSGDFGSEHTEAILYFIIPNQDHSIVIPTKAELYPLTPTIILEAYLLELVNLS